MKSQKGQRSTYSYSSKKYEGLKKIKAEGKPLLFKCVDKTYKDFFTLKGKRFLATSDVRIEAEVNTRTWRLSVCMLPNPEKGDHFCTLGGLTLAQGLLPDI